MAKKNAVAVDQSLAELVGNNKKLALTKTFLQDWENKARKLGGSLSAERVRRAIEELEIEITAIHSCARQYFASRNWSVQFG